MSGGFADEFDAIVGFFVTAWGSTTFLQLPNHDRREPPTDASWAKLNIKPAGAVRGALGRGTGALQRYAGVVIVQLFAPENTGERSLRELADTVVGIFQDQTLSDGVVSGVGGSGSIVFGSFELASLSGPIHVGSTYQMNVNVPYRRDRFQP